MNINKLDKYRLGNFELTEQHIYAKKKLTQIFNHILKKNQIGGANVNDFRNEIISELESKEMKQLLESNDLEEIIEKMKTSFSKNQSNENAIKDLNKEFQDLIKADEELISTFKQATDIYTSDLVVNKEGVKNILIKILKGLFDLQVKIIFTKLTKIKKIDVLPIFKVLDTKIEKMNGYINKLYTNFDIQSAEDTPKTVPSSGDTQSTSTNANLSTNGDSASANLPTSSANVQDSDSTNLSIKYQNIETNEESLNKFKNDLTSMVGELQQENILPKKALLIQIPENSDYNNETFAHFLDKHSNIKKMIDFYNDKDKLTPKQNYRDLASITNWEI